MKKKIIISFDTGFSGGKIIINKLVLNVPFVIIRQNLITDGDYSLRKADPSYISCEYDSEIYSIGQAAEDYLLRSKKSETTDATMQGLFTMSRFNTKEYAVMLKSLIGYALLKYAAYSSQAPSVDTFSFENIDNWDIYVGVSLPHSYMEAYRQNIRQYLIGEDENNPITHQMKLTIGANDPVDIAFQVNKRIICNSQLKNAIINELLSEDLKDVPSICDRENRPTLVIDGGYKTIGLGLVETDMSIANAVSNTEYAMLNINEAVSKQIEPFAEGYHDYMIDEMAEKNEVVRYLDDEKKVQEIHVKELKEKATEEAAENLIQFLLTKFDDMLRIKSILIAGGTGKAYQPYIEQFCKDNRAFLVDNIHIGTQNPENVFHGIMEVNGTFQQMSITDPVYTVVIGLFKEMCTKLD